MAQEPECKKCGCYVHYGPVLCEKCSTVLERDLARRVEDVQAATRTLKAANDQLAAARDLVEQEKTHSSNLLEQTEQLRHELAGAKENIAALLEEDWIWGKHSLVQIVKERGELKEKVAAAADTYAQYMELIHAVETKHGGESRHQTALRYIKQAEQSGDQGCEFLSAAREQAKETVKPQQDIPRYLEGEPRSRILTELGATTIDDGIEKIRTLRKAAKETA